MNRMVELSISKLIANPKYIASIKHVIVTRAKVIAIRIGISSFKVMKNPVAYRKCQTSTRANFSLDLTQCRIVEPLAIRREDRLTWWNTWIYGSRT